MKYFIGLLLLPFIVVVLFVFLLSWVCGVPVSVKRGNSKKVYRWFTRIG